MNIFKIHEYVLVDFIDEVPKVVSLKLTFEEAYKLLTEMWKESPSGPLPRIIEVSSNQCCSKCMKIFQKEIVYEIQGEEVYLYDVYCLKCAEEKGIDYYDATWQIFY